MIHCLLMKWKNLRYLKQWSVDGILDLVWVNPHINSKTDLILCLPCGLNSCIFKRFLRIIWGVTAAMKGSEQKSKQTDKRREFHLKSHILDYLQNIHQHHCMLVLSKYRNIFFLTPKDRVISKSRCLFWQHSVKVSAQGFPPC